MLKLNKILLPILIVFLAGCATKPVDPVIQTVIQKVEVPIPVPCNATIPAVPEFGFGSLLETDSIFLKVQTLLADRELHLGYETLLLAALESCVKK
jgi:hypothetical protein